MHRHVSYFVAVAAIGLAAPIATAQFADNFESAPSPSPLSWAAQQADPNLRTDSDPANTVNVSFAALAGQWFHRNKSGTPIHDIQVTNFNPPPAAGGSNYLRIHRGAGADTGIDAAFRDWNAGLTSGVVTVEFDLFIPTGQDGFVGGLYMTQFLDNDHANGTTGSLATLFFRADGTIRQSFGGFGNNPDFPGGAFNVGSWNHVVLVSNLSAQMYTLALNGGPASAEFAFNFPFVPGGGAKGFTFNGQEGKEYYVDNVSIAIPEPASLGILALAAVAALRRRG
jgi:hypothetical protein